MVLKKIIGTLFSVLTSKQHCLLVRGLLAPFFVLNLLLMQPQVVSLASVFSLSGFVGVKNKNNPSLF